MSIEDRIRVALGEAAERVESPPEASVTEVMADGRRRRRRRRVLVGVLSLIALLAVGAAALQLVSGIRPAVEVVGQSAVAQADVALFLCDGRECPAVTAEQRQALADRLAADTSVVRFAFESKAEAYDQFVSEFPGEREVEGVGPEDLPASFRVVLAEDTDLDAFIDRYNDAAAVEEAIDPQQPGSDR